MSVQLLVESACTIKNVALITAMMGFAATLNHTFAEGKELAQMNGQEENVQLYAETAYTMNNAVLITALVGSATTKIHLSAKEKLARLNGKQKIVLVQQNHVHKTRNAVPKIAGKNRKEVLVSVTSKSKTFMRA